MPAAGFTDEIPGNPQMSPFDIAMLAARLTPCQAQQAVLECCRFSPEGLAIEANRFGLGIGLEQVNRPASWNGANGSSGEV